MHRRGRTLCLITVLVCLSDGTASWGQQTYNPTASDPITGNTAGGTGALLNNRGQNNTAFGRLALGSNTNSGTGNTAFGTGALQSNTIGKRNTASGLGALRFNTTGSSNTVTGVGAMRFNTHGSNNTASGVQALYSNTTGRSNTATGVDALLNNATGDYNTASGFQALASLSTGIRNTASGVNALVSLSTGSRNTAIGEGAGSALINGFDNIYHGHPGVASESQTIRLGTPAVQTRTFIAGIAGVPVSGSTVLITSSGQLGILASSARYKQDIQPMGEQNQKLHQLRPVTFHYKEEPTGELQYGLIAEEVAKVYPELVIRNADGTIEGVRYEELTPLLLNEMQRQQQELAELRAQHTALAAQLERIEAGMQTTKREE